MPGGDVNKLDFKGFLEGIGYDKKKIAQGSQVNKWFFHAIIAGNIDSLTPYMQDMTVEHLKEQTGIADQCITVYVGRIQMGFGITRKGWIGVPTFGSYLSKSPLLEDV